MNKKKRTLFLFGAGASIPAGGKTTESITKDLLELINKSTIDNIKNEKCRQFIHFREYLLLLWKLINRTAQHDEEILPPLQRKLFEPNFENLAFGIEELDDNFNFIALNKIPFNYAELLSSISREYYGYRSIDAASHIITRIKREAYYSSAFNQMIHMKSTPLFLGALNLIAKFVKSSFPERYSTHHLNQLKKVIEDDEIETTVATTNYDLVFEQFFEENSIDYCCGFKNSVEIGAWEGFDYCSEKVKYLKLHGSFNWFRIPPDWFKEGIVLRSINQIYQVEDRVIRGMLREEILKKEKENVIQDILSPHIIIGGVKDRKSLDLPFIEVQLQWQNDIHSANVVIIVGASGGDTHLFKHLQALLHTNKKLEKIIVINPSEQALGITEAFLGSLRLNGRIQLFNLKSYWGDDFVFDQLGISLKDMVKYDNDELIRLFKNHTHNTTPVQNV